MAHHARASAVALALLSAAVPPVLGQGREPPPPPLPTGPITATVDLARTGEPIDRRLYGFFSELLGNMFEGGMWAEKLGDRKFFYPITNAPAAQGRGIVFGSRPYPATTPQNRRGAQPWRPLGPETRVVMDSSKAWVGAHSPRIALEPETPRGIQQAGLSFTQGRDYTGRVVLATGGTVTVSLVWGPGTADRQAITIKPARSNDYRTVPLKFTAGGSTRDGRLEIAGTGTGSLWIGAVSLMPADNVEGFRADLIAELKKVHPTHIRWGGNFSSGYDWRDGIGPYDKRPPRWDYAWGVVEQNDVGVLEILTLNRLLGTEPNIGVNAGFGDAHSAAELVEFVNGGKDTPMGKLRAQYGHPEPFNVKWWGIGNEMYGEWQLGHMAIGDYVIKHNMFAEKMRAVDPSITLVASGATTYETGTTARHHRKPLPSDRPYAVGSLEDWSGQLLKNSGKNINVVAEHIYANPDQYYDVDLQEFWPLNDPLHARLRRIANRVQGAVEDWQEYQKSMPFMKDAKIKMALDEWSSGIGSPMSGGEITNAVGIAMVLNEMFRHTEVWTMSAYTMLTGTVAYDRSEAKPALRAPGQVFKLYTEQFGSLPVQVTGDSPQPELRGTVGVDKGRVSSGSPTFPLDVEAALSADRKTLTVAVVNPSETQMTLKLAFTGGTPAGAGKVYTLATAQPNARTMPGQAPAATITETPVPDARAALVIAPLTVRIFEFQLQ